MSMVHDMARRRVASRASEFRRHCAAISRPCAMAYSLRQLFASAAIAASRGGS